MKRRFGAMLFVAAAVVAAGPELDACGDKSLSAGGIRMQRAMAARYPASVLAYVPSNSSVSVAAVELKLPQTLRQVGHKYHEVATLSELRASVETGRFNIIVADLGDIAELERNLGSSASVALVPVAYKLTKAETREAAKQRPFLIDASGKEVRYLRTITDAVRSVSATSRKG
jgi:hypothetical protein